MSVGPGGFACGWLWLLHAIAGITATVTTNDRAKVRRGTWADMGARVSEDVDLL